MCRRSRRRVSSGSELSSDVGIRKAEWKQPEGWGEIRARLIMDHPEPAFSAVDLIAAESFSVEERS